jgi:hypothetical protein
MQEYYLLTGEPLQLQQMQPEPQLSDFLDEEQKTALQTGEIAIVAAGLLLTGYLTYRFI